MVLIALVLSSATLLGVLSNVRSLQIDNHLVGDPIVDCQDTMVSLTFTTEKPFNGRVYVKGLADDDRCSKNFAANPDQYRFSMMVQNGDCNMQRQRVQGALEGLMFSLVIVVSFHGTFVTKVDRAYRCMCFFRNIKRVTNILDMSMIGTTELMDTAKTPSCSYSIHSGSPEGPLLRYAKVGDKLFHVWECDDPAQGFLVHSCWVNDGRGNRFDLLDIDGCAIDPIIQSDLKYDASLMKANVETHGYKFSDTTVLDYQCIIELCKKAQGECNGLTPPSCGRGRRAVPGDLRQRDSVMHDDNPNEFDITSSVNVIDTLDIDLESSGVPEKLIDQLNAHVFSVDGSRRASISQQASENKMCFSTPAFGILISIISLLFLAAAITTSLLYLRTRYSKT